MKTKQLYIKLLAQKEKNSIEFINKISLNSNHHFWGAARDFSKEILSANLSWKWLSYRIDDFASIAQRIMQEKLQPWLFKAQLECGKMKINNIYNTISWLLDRFVSELKNLFDPRTKNYINIIKIDQTLLQNAQNLYCQGINHDY
jgi:hypothetical protein